MDIDLLSNLSVTKRNALITASFHLPLTELRMLNSCISKIDPYRGLCKSLAYSFEIEDYIEIFNSDKKSILKMLEQAAKKLKTRKLYLDRGSLPENFINEHNITIELKDEKIETHWVKNVEINRESRQITIIFSDIVSYYLSDINQKGCFTSFKLKRISELKSLYAFRLYELLAKEQFLSQRLKITINDLKEKFFITGDKYSKYSNLKKVVIDTGVQQMNVKSNMVVNYSALLFANKTKHIEFTFEFKEDQAPTRFKKYGKSKTHIKNVRIAKMRKKNESFESAAKRYQEQEDMKEALKKKNKPSLMEELREEAEMGYVDATIFEEGGCLYSGSESSGNDDNDFIDGVCDHVA